MLNRRKKGRRVEIECAKLLEDAGWTVILTDMPHKWKLDQDFYNLFDIIGRKGKYIKYVQVKSNKMIGKKARQRYIDWGDKYPNPYQSIEVWVRIDGKKEKDRWDAHLVWFRE